LKLPILTVKTADKNSFVKFWFAQYVDSNESLYLGNIGEPLTKNRLAELFRWKNGCKLSEAKARSVDRNYVAQIRALKRLNPETPPAEFLNTFGGGMIWRIFLLHIWRPDRYPIFDQHVYRAMRYIQTGKIEKIPASYGAISSIYLKEYLAFYMSFPESSGRRVDKALWSFGKFLKSQFSPMLDV